MFLATKKSAAVGDIRSGYKTTKLILTCSLSIDIYVLNKSKNLFWIAAAAVVLVEDVGGIIVVVAVESSCCWWFSQ